MYKTQNKTQKKYSRYFVTQIASTYNIVYFPKRAKKGVKSKNWKNN